MKLKICEQCRRPYFAKDKICKNCPYPDFSRKFLANLGCLAGVIVAVLMLVVFAFFYFGIF